MPKPGIDDAIVTDVGDGRDDWRRSVRLFRSFLTEQTDPEGFYTLIADDAAWLMGRHMRLDGLQVADFGGGPGFYSDAFRRAGARSVVVDADIDEVPAARTARPAQPWSRSPSGRRWPTPAWTSRSRAT